MLPGGPCPAHLSTPRLPYPERLFGNELFYGMQTCLFPVVVTSDWLEIEPVVDFGIERMGLMFVL
jgi:hypothetical protein